MITEAEKVTVIGRAVSGEIPAAAAFDIMVDPASIGTAQQKRYGYANGRIRTFTNRKVARGMRIVTFLAKAQLAKCKSRLPSFGTPITLALTFYYAIPKSRAKGKDAYQAGKGATALWTADCDNRAKAVQDALINAGICANDKDITELLIRKRWIVTHPHIKVEIYEDQGE